MKFEDYLDALVHYSPTVMKKAAADFGEVREWLERMHAMKEVAEQW